MIKYVTGDATYPSVESGTRVIAHVLSSSDKWKSTFCKSISARWPDPEDHFSRKIRYSKKKMAPGDVQWFFATKDIAIASMIAKAGVRGRLIKEIVKYEELEVALNALAEGTRALIGLRDSIEQNELSIHMPKITCGQSGGDWDIVSSMIEDSLWDLDIYVYELPKKFDILQRIREP